MNDLTSVMVRVDNTGKRNRRRRGLVESLVDSVGIRSLLKRSTRHLNGREAKSCLCKGNRDRS